MDEILINQLRLDEAIRHLSSLQFGTGYSGKGPQGVVTKSIGNTAESLNDLYSGLDQVEKELIELTKKTRDVLVSAGVKFDTADITAQREINNEIGRFEGDR